MFVGKDMIENRRCFDDRTECLAAVLVQCPALAHLNLQNNDIGDDGAEGLAGVLAQCTALQH